MLMADAMRAPFRCEGNQLVRPPPWVLRSVAPSGQTLGPIPISRAPFCARRVEGRRSASNGSRDPCARDPSRNLHARVDAELVEDAREVALDCPLGDEQLGRHL